jgi:putative nucleotidyltransferase with HDIG domain
MSPQTTRSELATLFGKQIAARQLELPMMPGVAAEVLSLVQLESTDAAKLSAVVHRDQTLASNVLRVANSAAYVGQVPVASLQQAVSRLGMQMITDIAMAVSVKSRVFQNPAYADLLAGLWRHSVLTGYFTKEIARSRRRNVEIAFIAGLLHDIGKAVLLSNLDRIGKGANVPIELLSEALHEQHAAAGALLASEWRMPEQLHEAIVFHHQYEQATKFGDLAMMVCLADLLAHLLSPNLLGSLPMDSVVRSHPVLAALNIYPDQLDALLLHADKAIQVAESMA